ncbi:acetoacetate metabolism regulatory protein AtoC [Desulfosarcina widdelii]|uniref:Acetoacetate metabolism regulatory protein AtoC n=1 Tax=Desulfosarcina widdelii TaxID=947919 RepID=A0A5K7ZB87_9BACT|nr:sigma-54 dependent transcriptional regulator [Desulfosarcina widdelii]BBO77439.1 acetoacetate metabolism regulatory protein AtoC [Desulfosarcina widdelii]
MKPNILIVDDETPHRAMLDTVLSAEGYNVIQAEDGDEAIELVGNQFFNLILMDVRMKRIDGIKALQQILKISPQLPIIIMTAYGSVDSAVKAMKSGAIDYITKPIDIDILKISIDKALTSQQITEENALLKERLGEKFDIAGIIGRSKPMKRLLESISMVAPSDANVLILGESGTGKELIANAIHQNSYRKDKPFIKINCAALPDTLLESELFGHEKGAFTGAIGKKMGRFKLADKGSIFLDEIAEMAPPTQAKILRVIQEQEFEPVGGTSSIKVDTRIIAATNRVLKKEVEEGNFREDLFYRLNVVELKVPPLRERSDDILPLSNYFLAKYTKKNKRQISGFTPMAMDLLMRHDWPGNVRELENIIERSVIMTRSNTIKSTDLPATLRGEDLDKVTEPVDLTPGRSLKDVEKEMILRTLEEHNGNRTHAAKTLGISRRTLQLKLKDYGIT